MRTKGGGKKKSKSAKKDEWTFEGGSYAQDESETTENNKKIRVSQERDERMRRSRLKLAMKQSKSQFRKKMASKVKFDDVIEKKEMNEIVEEREVKMLRPNPPSTFDRLQLFVKKSLKGPLQDLNVTPVSAASEPLLTQSDEVEEYDVNDDAMHFEKTDNDETYGNDILKAFFGQSKSLVSCSGWNQVQDVKELQGTIFANLSPSFKFSAAPIRSVSQIPNLYKLWHSAGSLLNGNAFESSLLPYLSAFADAFIEGRTHRNDDDILHAALVHAVVHAVRSRAKVIKHNQKLKQKAADAKIASAAVDVSDGKKMRKRSMKAEAEVLEAPASAAAASASSLEDMEEVSEEAIRDQGFCRPRILILCPFRSVALRVVREMLAILGENTSVYGLDKFEEEFSAPDDDEEENEVGEAAKEEREASKNAKPEDWRAVFDKQNLDDDFKIGVQLNPGHGKGSGASKGEYMRLFSDFLISDVIIASPLGLRLAIENSKSKGAEGEHHKLNYDFLSSIEVALLHQADILYMQNWEHVEFVLRHMNKLPTSSSLETDYSRVRPYFLEGKGNEHRQLLMTSQVNEPEMNAFFRQHANSVAGAIRLKANWQEGCIADVMNGVRQVFQQIPGVKSFGSAEDDRFQFFKEHILAQVLKLKQARTLIVAPSYFHYVRIRNELMAQEASAAFVCEYSRDSEFSRSRSRFFHGKKDILLYSGRAHFFRRFRIRGARHVIFYSLPELPHFYSEIVNMLQLGDAGGDDAEDSSNSCLALYTQYEAMALERIVGKSRSEHMLTSRKNTFLFK